MPSLPKPYAHHDRLVRNNMYVNEDEILSNITLIHKHMNSVFIAVPHFTVTVAQSITVYAAVLFMCTVFDS